MARFRQNRDIGAVSGRIGGQVYRATSRGPTVATRRRRKVPASAAQVASRARFALLPALWRGLSDATRAEWTAAARQLPRPNRLGVTRHLTGWQLFQHVQGFRLLAGISNTSAPSQLILTSPAQPVAIVVKDDPLYSVQLILANPTSPTRTLIYATTRRGAAPTAAWNRWHLVGLLPAGGGIAIVTAEFEARFGPLRAGMTVKTRWRSIATDGLPSAPQERETTVTT